MSPLHVPPSLDSNHVQPENATQQVARKTIAAAVTVAVVSFILPRAVINTLSHPFVLTSTATSTDPPPPRACLQLKGKFQSLVSMFKATKAEKGQAESTAAAAAANFTAAAEAAAAASGEIVARLESELSRTQDALAGTRTETAEALSREETETHRAADVGKKTVADRATEVADLHAELEGVASREVTALTVAAVTEKTAEVAAHGKVKELEERMAAAGREKARLGEELSAAVEEVGELRRAEEELHGRVGVLEEELESAQERLVVMESVAGVAAEEVAAARGVSEKMESRLKANEGDEGGAAAAARVEGEEKAQVLQEALEAALSEKTEVRFECVWV